MIIQARICIPRPGASATAVSPAQASAVRAERVNARGLGVNAREAGEQCGRLTLPEVFEPDTLDHVESGHTPAEELLEAYSGRRNDTIDPVFSEYAY